MKGQLSEKSWILKKQFKYSAVASHFNEYTKCHKFYFELVHLILENISMVDLVLICPTSVQKFLDPWSLPKFLLPLL